MGHSTIIIYGSELAPYCIKNIYIIYSLSSVMSYLVNITATEFRNAFNDVGDVKATKRITVAIAYKQGVSQTDLADCYGLSRKTMFNWLQRFTEDSVRPAVRDESRPGRPPKLDREERSKISQLLCEPPANAGYDATEWRIPLVQQLFDEQVDITYSRTSAYRLRSRVE